VPRSPAWIFPSARAARLLGIDERTMRKYIAGDLVIPEMLVESAA
jgi:hypothetical protein